MVSLAKPPSLTTVPIEILYKIICSLRPVTTKEELLDGFVLEEMCVMDMDPNKATDRREIWLSRTSFRDLSDRRARLVPVARVCRLWNKIATELLYTEIDAKDMERGDVIRDDSDSEDSEKDSEDEESDDEYESIPVCYRLARTLSDSPHLGRLVRRIILGTYRHDRETTKYHIEILRHCPLAEDVKIYGYNGYLLETYRPVVANLHSLRTLSISRHCLADLENSSFVSHDEFLKMLQGWPRLEQVRMPSLVGSVQMEDIVAYCKERGFKLDFD